MRVLEAFGDGGLTEGAQPGESGVLVVEVHAHRAVLVALLFALQAHRERTADRVSQPLALCQDNKMYLSKSLNCGRGKAGGGFEACMREGSRPRLAIESRPGS